MPVKVPYPEGSRSTARAIDVRTAARGAPLAGEPSVYDPPRALPPGTRRDASSVMQCFKYKRKVTTSDYRGDSRRLERC